MCRILLYWGSGGGGFKGIDFSSDINISNLVQFPGQPISITDTKLNQVDNILNEKNCS